MYSQETIGQTGSRTLESILCIWKVLFQLCTKSRIGWFTSKMEQGRELSTNCCTTSFDAIRLTYLSINSMQLLCPRKWNWQKRDWFWICNKTSAKSVTFLKENNWIGNIHIGHLTILGHFGHTYLPMSHLFYTMPIALIRFLLIYLLTPKADVLCERSHIINRGNKLDLFCPRFTRSIN